MRTLVRLGFHDCASASCDSCIDEDAADNNGLAPVVAALTPSAPNMPWAWQTALLPQQASLWRRRRLQGTRKPKCHCSLVGPTPRRVGPSRMQPRKAFFRRGKTVRSPHCAALEIHTVSTSNIGSLQALYLGLRPQPITLPNPTNMFKWPNGFGSATVLRFREVGPERAQRLEGGCCL